MWRSRAIVRLEVPKYEAAILYQQPSQHISHVRAPQLSRLSGANLCHVNFADTIREGQCMLCMLALDYQGKQGAMSAQFAILSQQELAESHSACLRETYWGTSGCSRCRSQVWLLPTL